MNRKLLYFKQKATNGFSKLKETVKSKKLKKLKKKLKLERRAFFVGAVVVISVFGSTFLTPALCAFAQELSSSQASKYAKLFPSKKSSFRDYLPWKEWKKMLAELPGKSPSAMAGIIAAELTYQILRALGLVAVIHATRVVAIRIPDAYFAFIFFAKRMAKTKPTKNELFSEVVDGVTNAF